MNATLTTRARRDEIAPPNREVPAIAMLDRRLQQLTRSPPPGDSVGIRADADEAAVQLFERERIVEQRRINDRPYDRQFVIARGLHSADSERGFRAEVPNGGSERRF